MKNIRIYKKGLLIGMSAMVILPSITGCSGDVEVTNTETESVKETPDWVKERMPYTKEEEEITKEDMEKAAIDAFESWSSDIEESFSKLNDSTMVVSAKEAIATNFIHMTDFLFYGGEIQYGNGKVVTLSALTDTAKKKIELIYSIVDSKIESYWPNYKEEIEEKWQLGKGYVADKANTLKLYLLEKASEHMTEEEYAKAGEYWDLFKEQTKSDYENGKEFLKNLWDSGTEYTDEKYQQFKQEHSHSK